jgi:hypothetical protein
MSESRPPPIPAWNPWAAFYAPLSGDVTQAINPWTWLQRISGGQFGAVNINIGRTPDPALEQRIVEQVGSYGSQLGRIGDVLAVLVQRLDLSTLSIDEKAAVHDFLGQYNRIQGVKRTAAERGGPAAPPG